MVPEALEMPGIMGRDFFASSDKENTIQKSVDKNITEFDLL